MSLILIHKNGRKPRKIAIANQKGGTAKTTTAINLSAGLARRGHRVLLVDMDPQANASTVFLGAEFTLNPKLKETTTYEVLMGKVPSKKAIKEIKLESNKQFPNEATFYLLPSHVRLARTAMEVLTLPHREHRLTHALKTIEHEYHYIIIDCPPTLGLLTINALMAAREVIIPVEPGFFSLVGIGLLHQTISDLKSVNRGLKLLGMLPTLQDRTNESRETEETLQEIFPDYLLPGIPRRVAVKEAHGRGMDIFGYDGQNDAALAYSALVEEVEKHG